MKRIPSLGRWALPRCWLLGLVWMAMPAAGAEGTTLSVDDPEVTRWEAEVAALESLDETEDDPADAILFIGSSSVRLWDSIAADMAPWPVIRRGYGGARYRDLCHYAGRLVEAHAPRAVVVFVANDITSPTESPALEDVMADVRATLAAIRASHPDVPVLFVAVTPTESRWRAWPRIQEFNRALAGLAAVEREVFFIPTADGFLDPATGEPQPALFRADRLHLSRAGYRIWADLIRKQLAAVLGEPARPEPAAAAN